MTVHRVVGRAPRRPRSCRIAPVVLALVAGCAATPPAQPAPVTSFPPLPLDEFPGAASLLSGFDDRTAAPEWAAHDQVLFALRLDKGGEVVRWLLQIDATAAVPVAAGSPGTVVENADGSGSMSMAAVPAVVTVRVFRADGALLDETKVAVPANYLGQGLLPAIRARSTGMSTMPASAQFAAGLRDWMVGFFTMKSMLGVVRENDVLAGYFWQVVETPGLWSVITRLGVSVAVDMPFEKSVAVSLPAPLPPAAESFSVPLRIDVNGSPALFVDLLGSEASRPYAICGGIVAAIARHPTRSDVTFRMQLVAARCGR